MYFKPTRLLLVNITTVLDEEYWSEYEAEDIWAGYPYKYKVTFNVQYKSHSDPYTNEPFNYTGDDIQVGDWIASGLGGLCLRITEIVTPGASTVTVIAEDVDRFNTITDSYSSGYGSINVGNGVVFSLDAQGMPVLQGIPQGFLPETFASDLFSRFSLYNEYKKYIRVTQEDHTFEVGDFIYLDTDGKYKLVTANEANKETLNRIAGTVTSVGIPSVKSFTYMPRGVYVRDISPALPTADPGSLIYLDPANPGKLTATKPAEYAVPIYIRLSSDTEGIFLTGGAGVAEEPERFARSLVVADIDGRDELTDPVIGDLVFVEDTGDGKWGHYILLADDPELEWHLLAAEQPASSQSSDKIIDTDEDTWVDVSSDNIVSVVANSQPVATFESNENAVLGEHIQITHDEEEVHLVAKSELGTESINIRLIPQGEGEVLLGTVGDGIIEPEATFDLDIRGGESDGASAPGSVIITGGKATSGNFNGGDVVIVGGKGYGNGVDGKIIFKDQAETGIAEFLSSGSASANYFYFENSTGTNGIKLGASASSVASNVDVVLDPKGTGLVKVADYSTYSSALLAAGNNDALVTKGYVASLGVGGGGGGSSFIPGIGLTDDAGTININIEASTVGVDGSNNLIVASSSVANQVLISTGVLGEEATWGALNLSVNSTFTGVLGQTLGGTGITTYAEGDILLGNSSNGLSKKALGQTDTYLKSDGTTLVYDYIVSLTDESGELVVQAQGQEDAINYLVVRNAPTNEYVEIGTESVDDEDSDVSILFVPKGDGVLFVPAGYSENITEDETLVTKKYVDDAMASGTETYMRRATLNDDWASTMNIGEPSPNVADKEVYVHRVMLVTTTPLSGGGVYQAKVMSGTNTLMEMHENDVLVEGTYIVDLPEAFTSSNTQFTIEFYAEDGETATTPEDGSITVSVFYRIV